MKDYSQYFVKPSLQDAAKRSKEVVPIIRDALAKDPEISMMTIGKKYIVRTFGCQANERDGETIAGILEEMGYTLAESLDEADVIILNTCAVREGAEDRVFGEIGHLKRLKRLNPDLIFGICGCMPQQEEVVNRILKTADQVDLIFGTHNLHKLPELIKHAYFSKERVVQVYSKEGEIYENLPSKREGNLKAWVNIMYGCDKFCTYCIVPYTRGKERSRLMEDILKEVVELKASGYKEITLLGQNVNAYGNDLKLGYNFETLLRKVAQTGIERIRFTTSHPWNFTDGMINAIKDYPNVMPYVHLPLQSGDTEILRRMGRRYTSEEYLNLYNKIRNTVPGVSITTDIIVGFPNESDEQFENTMKMVETCRYDAAFTFIYSPRPGTPAARMEDPITMEKKKERFNRLVEAVTKHSKERNLEYVGKEILVLVEGVSKKNSNILSGYSESNKLVNFKGSNDLIGKIVKVKILRAKAFTLEGEAIE